MNEDKIVCPTCKGTKEVMAELTEIKEDGTEKVNRFPMGCTRCDKTGEIYAEQLIWEEQEKEIWCSCKEDHGVNFYDDGNSKEYPHGFTCTKHHYACKKCNLIVQIG